MTSTPIHLAAWNVNHRGGQKTIPATVLHAIATLDVDVLVLTEFVDGPHHTAFRDALQDIGFNDIAVSVRAPHQNQVLIAARTPMASDGLIAAPAAARWSCSATSAPTRTPTRVPAWNPAAG